MGFGVARQEVVFVRGKLLRDLLLAALVLKLASFVTLLYLLHQLQVVLSERFYYRIQPRVGLTRGHA